VTGAAFSPVPTSHHLVLGISIACAFLFWAAMLAAMVLLAKREERED
jgi:hypothetical protein